MCIKGCLKMRRLFFFQVAFEHSRDGERTIQSVYNLLESKVESWLGKKPKGHLDNSMWAGKMQAHLLNLLHILKKLVSDFEHFPRTRLRISTLTLFGVFCQNPIFLRIIFLGSPSSKDIWCKERSVLQCCNPFVKCHATSFLKDNWDIRAWNRPWRNAKAKKHVWKPRSLVVQEIPGGLCLIVSNSFFDLHAPWNRAESKWTYAIPTMISWMRNCPEWFS